MRIVALFLALCVLPGLHALELVDDATWANLVAEKEVADRGTTIAEQFESDMELCEDYFRARLYDKQAKLLEFWISKVQRINWLYSNLSVAYGKLGRYAEAKAMAEKAIALDPKHAMHGQLVIASWEWNLGNKEVANSIIASVPEPETTSPKYLLYHKCRACFYASAADREKMAAAIRITLASHDEKALIFYQRDVVFDPYRNEPWFISLVGKTLK